MEQEKTAVNHFVQFFGDADLAFGGGRKPPQMDAP